MQQLLLCRLCPDSRPLTDEYPDAWQQFASDAPIDRFIMLSDKIHEARKQLSFNVNYQAIIEQLLLVFTGEISLWVK